MSLKTFSLRRKQPSSSTNHGIEGVEMSEDQTVSLKRGDEKRIMLMKMVKEGVHLFLFLNISENFVTPFLVYKAWRGSKLEKHFEDLS